MSLIDYVWQSTQTYVERMPKGLRKKYGQFFTSRETAMFMAQLFDVPNSSTISMLDPGAGSGILTAALVDRLSQIDGIDTINITCYENDTNILVLLDSNLQWICAQSPKTIHYQIIAENYILYQSAEYNALLFANPFPPKYDLIIGNPPYMKVSKDAPETLAMQDICYGAPNLYFLFAEMSLFNLKEKGEMVYIIPRSWTSGAYFKQFRQSFLRDGAIEHIHLFTSRDKVFEKENVLQETVIIKVRKSLIKPKYITITTSVSNADFSDKSEFLAEYSTIIRGEDSYVYLVTNIEEATTLSKLNQWKNTLPSIGLRMKTGLTVDFRNKSALRDTDEEKAVPLFLSQHIQDGKVIFPVGRRYEYIVTEQKGLLQSNTNYLFVKRFTSKEERRRLQCGVYLARKYPRYQTISTQNKINFVCGKEAMSDCMVYGLYVLFNSTIYDTYYRILNGSTQVNSTEMNSIPVPPVNIIENMGKALIQSHDMSEASCDEILRSYL